MTKPEPKPLPVAEQLAERRRQNRRVYVLQAPRPEVEPEGVEDKP